MSVSFGEPELIRPGRQVVVCLERVDVVPSPDYVVMGKAMCMACDSWCWLDAVTLKVVRGAGAFPVCLECATANPDCFGRKVVR